MKQSQVLIPTLKENPTDAEAISHQLMVRAGYINQISAGVYAYLPLALRVLQNIEKIIRQEMENIGAVEMLTPGILPADLWRQSGRYDTYGDNLFKLQDRHERDFILGPTHEETFTYLVKNVLNSYKKLPKVLYQIQTKYRDEDRPRYGLLRGREFIMKDAYSFTANRTDLDRIFDQMEQAYRNIYDRCGLDYRVILGDSGDMGGSGSKEFSAMAAIGEDTIVYSDSSDYAANLEMATSIIAPNQVEAPAELTSVATSRANTVEDMTDEYQVSASKILKSMAFMADDQPVLALIRGDYEVNEVKLKNALQAQELRPANEAEIKADFQSAVGFLGPVQMNTQVKIVADLSTQDLSNSLTGANQAGLNWQNVNPDRDYQVSDYLDFRTVKEGEVSPDQQGKLQFKRGIEIGHIFKLGTKYSESMAANFLDENGRQQPIIMGCYGIGISRLLSAVIEQHNDDHGIVWPWALAPYQVHVVEVNAKKEDQQCLGSEIEQMLTEAGFSVLVDDRKERAGVKFAESDLMGLPVRITIGKKAAEGIAEIKLRNQADSIEVHQNDLIESMRILLKNYK
ncbi:proline--tRNA ligase [Lactobacillus sp. DCY120]|uniref:Proline--tRNA ligase n=1 Tax=Bombilactobacillus apium TaxID=2675299 RepID=A0A850R1N5_9LACO|nr:proline--tRNA ligase [Bombilactobacillus apium]NVY97029.1 proline--tRNA ligase [Bombilactobacillus apium]